ncbi:MAG TPA: glycosyltransferase [Candidatus Cottocaccamicrobium excrementipullorum]|nr:glycosyltransferase [Candidatus Cottocaccamicrobium excrementipullorum]
MYKVSIILPIYNVSQYLRECLDSVIRQTLKELEIICVNDGSTDDSLEIIQEYAAKDDRIVVITGPNGGYGKAMNKGLDRATGEYVGIVEPDDYVSLTMFEDLYQIAKENDLDIVKADFYRFARNDRGDMDMRYVNLDGTKEKYGRLLYPDQDPSLIKFTMNTWSGIYRRAMLEEHHIRHHETPGASFQDNGFFFKTTVYAKRAMIINRPYYRNRRDNPNSSVNNREKVYCINIEYDYIRDFLMEDREVWERFKYMYTWKKFHNYLFTINRIGEEFRPEYVQRMSAEFKRAKQQGEFTRDMFTELEWKKMTLILEHPEKYLEEYASPRGGVNKISQSEADRLKRELDMIKNSTTYKVGKLIMAIPCGLKRRILSK